jgi:hypothetical protein
MMLYLFGRGYAIHDELGESNTGAFLVGRVIAHGYTSFLHTTWHVLTKLDDNE